MRRAAIWVVVHHEDGCRRAELSGLLDESRQDARQAIRASEGGDSDHH
jgi:hypothetical protein